MRFYEVVAITKADAPEEWSKNFISMVEGFLAKDMKKAEKGEVMHVDNWGTRKLVHPVKKQTKGHYFVITIKCLPKSLDELLRNFKIIDDVLMFQSVRLNKEPVFKEPEETDGQADDDGPNAEPVSETAENTGGAAEAPAVN